MALILLLLQFSSLQIFHQIIIYAILFVPLQLLHVVEQPHAKQGKIAKQQMKIKAQFSCLANVRPNSTEMFYAAVLNLECRWGSLFSAENTVSFSNQAPITWM